jgi:hypothetical protein
MAKSTRPRAVTTRLPLESHRSTVEQGSQFEKTVEEVFRDMPNATVEPHVLIGGKDVDLYVVVKTPLSNEMRIACDTKDYARPLTRDQAAAELMSYSPLLQQRLVDQVMLVTRNGVATKAKLVFDGKSTVHHTVEELQNLIVNPSNLIESMEHQFLATSSTNFMSGLNVLSSISSGQPLPMTSGTTNLSPSHGHDT